MPTYIDPASGRHYTVDPQTGQSRWLDPTPELTDTQVLPPWSDGYGPPPPPLAPDGGGPGYLDHPPDEHWHPEEPRPVPGQGLLALAVIVGALVVLALIGAMVTGARNRGATASPSALPPSATATAPTSAAASSREPAADRTDPVEGAIGTPVRDGRFEFTVTGTRTAKEVGSGFLTRTADGRFLLVSVTVRNVGDSDQVFLAMAQRLYDTEGRSYSADAAAAVSLGVEAKNLVSTVSPGSTVEGTLAFDVPAGVTVDRIRLHDSFLSGGAEVTLHR